MHSMVFTLLVLLVSLCSGIEICPSREVTESSGRITSSGYPGKYAANTNCIITIRQPLDTKITFTFSKIDIEGDDDDDISCYDSLEAIGMTTKIFCGTTLPAPYSPKLNIVKLQMISDDSVQRSGFDLTYTTVQITGLPTPVSICNTVEANAAQTGRIMSPSFPDNYGDNLDCKLTLKIPPNKKTEITYEIFSIEHAAVCANDKLLISSKGGQKKEACGTGSPTPAIFEGDEVYFHLTTNSNNNAVGFMLKYTLIDVLIPTYPTTQPPGVDNSCACPDGNQYIKRLLPQNNMVKRQNDDISLEFKTTQPSGLLLYAKGNVRDYILLKLENGNIVFEVDLGTGVAKVPVASGNLNDNVWHSVQIQRRGKTVTVKVNNGQSQAIKITPGPYSMLDIKGSNGALYVLGGPSGIPFPYNFRGCVRNFILDSMKPIEAVNNNVPSYVMYGLSNLNKCSN